MKDIVFTGMSCITPAGSGVDDMVKAVAAFQSKYGAGSSPLGTRFSEQSECSGGVFYNADTEPAAGGVRAMRNEEADRMKTLGSFPRLDRGVAYLLTAVRQALEDSHIELKGMKKDRIGVVVGTTFGMWSCQARFLKALAKTSKPSSVLFQQTTNNLYSGAVAYQYGLFGHNVTLYANWTAGVDAILYAKRLIAQDCCDAVVVGAIDTIDETARVCYRNMKSAAADGKTLKADFVLGEAAAVVIMESADFAARARHPVLGRFLEGAHSRYYSAGEIVSFLSGRVLRGDAGEAYMANANHTFVDSAESRVLCACKPEVVYIKRALGECGAASGCLQVIYGLKKYTKSVMFCACITGKMGYLRIFADQY